VSGELLDPATLPPLVPLARRMSGLQIASGRCWAQTSVLLPGS